MASKREHCPDYRETVESVNRRDFLTRAGMGAAAAMAGPMVTPLLEAAVASKAAKTPETIVGLLHDSLSPAQKKAVCFAWDHVDPRRGLLRQFIAANWRITEHPIHSDFYTAEQQHLIRRIFEGIIAPDWHERLDKQMTDDDGGFGTQQRIAIFGKPGREKFQFVLSGRHLTVRCDGNSAEHLAFGGPIVYGHAAQGFNEKPNHPGNVFWHQAEAANNVYKMLDDRQRKLALLDEAPPENQIAFRKAGEELPGIPLGELSGDQKQHVEDVLRKLVEPYRQSDRDEVAACLKAQGGLDRCHLAFYRDGDLGDDGVWDIWRLEGPAFVWHFRGSPHVHTWVHVAAAP